MDEAILKVIRGDIRKELIKTKDTNHDFDHACRVWGNAEEIAKRLGMKIDYGLLEVMCWLHDLTWTKKEFRMKHYFNESKLSKAAAKDFLKDYKISPEEKEIIVNAISKHPLGFPWRNLNENEDVYTKILQDADILDSFSNERIAAIKKNTNKIWWSLINVVIKVSKANIKRYLNYPELVTKWFTSVCKI